MHFGLPLRVANGNSDIDPAFCVCVFEMVILVGWSENLCALWCVWLEDNAPANFARFRPCAASTGEEKVYSS